MLCVEDKRCACALLRTSSDACLSWVRPLLAVTWPELVQLELAKVPPAQLGATAAEALAAYKVCHIASQALLHQSDLQYSLWPLPAADGCRCLHASSVFICCPGVKVRQMPTVTKCGNPLRVAPNELVLQQCIPVPAGRWARFD